MRSLGGGTNTLGGGPAEPLNSVKQAVNQLVHTMCMGQKTEKDWNEQGQTGRVFQLRVGSGSGIEKIFLVGLGRVGYRVFVSNTKSIGYYGVLKS